MENLKSLIVRVWMDGDPPDGIDAWDMGRAVVAAADQMLGEAGLLLSRMVSPVNVVSRVPFEFTVELEIPVSGEGHLRDTTVQDMTFAEHIAERLEKVTGGAYSVRVLLASL